MRHISLRRWAVLAVSTLALAGAGVGLAGPASAAADCSADRVNDQLIVAGCFGMYAGQEVRVVGRCRGTIVFPYQISGPWKSRNGNLSNARCSFPTDHVEGWKYELRTHV